MLRYIIVASMTAAFAATTAHASVIDCSDTGLFNDALGDATEDNTDLACGGIEILDDLASFTVAFADDDFDSDDSLPAFFIDADQDGSTGLSFSGSNIGTEFVVSPNRFGRGVVTIEVRSDDGSFADRLVPEIDVTYLDNGMTFLVPLSLFAIGPEWDFEIYSQRRITGSAATGIGDVLQGPGGDPLTSIQASAVPVPPAFVLMGAGLAALGAFRKRGRDMMR